ncbi:unnamed protein product [Prunus armeniaca]
MVDLMDRQAFRIETSFMAAMDKFSTELRTLFQEGMPVTPTHTQASSYGPHSQPKSWGQSQPTRVNPGPTCPKKMKRGPLHALAVSLGRNSPKYPATQKFGSVRASAIHAHPGPGDATATLSQRHGQNDPTVSLSQASLFPPGSHPQYGSVAPTATHTNPGQTYDAYLKPPCSVATAEPFVQMTQQIEPHNNVQRVLRPLPIRLELPSQDPRTKEVRRASKDSAMGTSPYVFAHDRGINKLIRLRVRPLRVFEQLGQKTNYGLTVPQDSENLGRPGLDAYASAQVQKEMAPRAYDKKVKKKKRGGISQAN